ncbi:hypothetical protein BAUCODRAFT_544830 [Baudoinia panamericana UAMH 10762]|uniref:Uncharacterized protein n=1 Tax=Baudoinia panamericana (strain UAMH 10762) TaxID=717646 RepID=M2LJB7_BAUPA|nr:uncharacterized protein BAUCODRAFT_544830 [Baudoinia panamericana UAMH 10762]EMC94332.1 hypothetical protein BAUCODRAFT_544830 [Baudoinia panamericana UAMH 10762]
MLSMHLPCHGGPADAWFSKPSCPLKTLETHSSTARGSGRVGVMSPCISARSRNPLCQTPLLRDQHRRTKRPVNVASPQRQICFTVTKSAQAGLAWSYYCRKGLLEGFSWSQLEPHQGN